MLLCLPTKNTTRNHSLLLFSAYLSFCKPFLLPSRSLSDCSALQILLNLFLALSSLPTQSGCLVKSMLNCEGLGEAITSVLLPQPVTATSIPCKKRANQHQSLVLTIWWACSFLSTLQICWDLPSYLLFILIWMYVLIGEVRDKEKELDPCTPRDSWYTNRWEEI